MSGLLQLPFTIVYGLYMNNDIGQPAGAKICFADSTNQPLPYTSTSSNDYAVLTATPGVTNVTESFHMVMTFGFWAYLLMMIFGNIKQDSPPVM